MAAEKDSAELFAEFDEFTAREPENYAEAFRQREILRTSSDVNELFSNARQAFERDEINKAAERSIARSAVERLIMDVEHMVQAVGNSDLLENDVIYEIKLSPPDELIEIVKNNQVRILGTPDLSPKTADGGTIRGLWGFLNAPEFFSATWSVQADLPHQKPDPISRSTVTRMPVDASKETFRHVRSFLADVDLDLGPNLPDYMGEEGPGL